jgi:hypothetical protein
VIAVLGVVWPLAITVPLAMLLVWLGLALLIRASRLRRERRAQGLPSTMVRPASQTTDNSKVKIQT